VNFAGVIVLTHQLLHVRVINFLTFLEIIRNKSFRLISFLVIFQT
jgi:hypothetical protein